MSGWREALRAAWRAQLRDWRAGELRVLALALIVAVAAVTAVGFFTDRVERAMLKQGAALIAADLLLESSREIAPQIAARADELGLRHHPMMTFPSVLLDEDDDSQLISLKAVGEGYPLRGELLIGDRPFAAGRPAEGLPAAGEIWVDPRLFARMELQLGERVLLGAREFTVAAVIAHEPDRGASLFQLAPRVIMRHDDLPGTGLVSEASRVRHRLLLAGELTAVETLQAEVEADYVGDVRVRGLGNARPELASALERAESYLGLAALVAVILSGAAIAVAANGFAERQADAVAVMRCLGAEQRFVLRVLLLRLLLVGLAASLLGVLAGFTAQSVLAALLAQWFGGELPLAGVAPALAGVATGLVALLGFALPPVLRLRRLPVLRVLRRDLGLPDASVLGVAVAALLAVGALMVWQAGNFKLAALVIAGCLGTLGLLGAAAWLSLAALRRAPGEALIGWRFGIANLARRARANSLALVAFGVGIMALLLLTLVRVDLLEAWRAELPADAPNHFVINVQPDEVEALRERIAAAGVEVRGLFPMIRGRLLSINGEPVSEDDYPDDDRAQRLATRDFNLSFAAEPRADNPLVAGQWWAPDTDQLLWSVEDGIAKTLGIEMGDELRYRVAGSEVVARVANLREVSWDSFQVNFFVTGTPATLAAAPATYITSFHLPPAEAALVPALLREFPGITLIDVDGLMQRVRQIVDRAAAAVEFVFAFTLLAGVVVLIAAVQASRAERARESALLRALGASRGQVIGGVIAEFAALGLLAGALAAAAASLLGWAVAAQVFQVDYTFNPWLWLIGAGGGALGIAAVGLAATRGVLARPPLQGLREGI